MKNKLIGIVASVAMALLGTALLVSYVQGADDRNAPATPTKTQSKATVNT